MSLEYIKRILAPQICYNNPIKMHEKRRDLLRERCRERKIDGYLTFDYFDVSYLSGFFSEGCFSLISRAGDTIFAPLLLAGQARSTVDAKFKVVSERSLLKAFEKTVKKHHLKTIGFDPDKCTVSLSKALLALPKINWVPIGAFVLSQRMVKDSGEIEKIRRACRITTRSCQQAFQSLKSGQTERETARGLENLFHNGGAEKTAFETIVAFGENASYPHHVVTAKTLEQNTAVLMDCGCTVGGYRSDLTRTSFFGKLTSSFQKIYKIVQEAQAAGIASVSEGVSAGKVDFISREVIRKAGYGDYYIHGTGHGVGLEIHEPPRLGIESKEILKEGMVVTVEPGIYLPGEFGVRIEDTLLVKPNGYEILTTMENEN